VVLVVNKWDLVENKDVAEFSRYIRSQLRFVSHAPIVYTSAMLRQATDRVMPEAFGVYQQRLKRLPTTVVNSVVQEAVAAHHPPRKGARQLKILYATQAEVNPPTFVFFVNDARLMSSSYQRYLENKLRRAQGFNGTPLRFIFKNRSEQLS
jgi:GTP-binding protein